MFYLGNQKVQVHANLQISSAAMLDKVYNLELQLKYSNDKFES